MIEHCEIVLIPGKSCIHNIHFFSWIFPLIGHTGICTSEGIIHDFARPYNVSVDNMTFGQPTKYWQLDLPQVKQSEFDEAVQKSSQEHRGRMVSGPLTSFKFQLVNKLFFYES